LKMIKEVIMDGMPHAFIFENKTTTKKENAFTSLFENNSDFFIKDLLNQQPVTLSV
jgi:hypothetical protein